MSHCTAQHDNLHLHALPALESNYIWAIVNATTSHVAIVDPGDARIVLEWLTQQPSTLALTTVILTHHHYDHTDGLAELAAHFPTLTVYGPASVKGVTHPVSEGSTCDVLGYATQVMETPAHTLDHVCYLITPEAKSAKPILLTGDTLFMAGCGRLFEGTAEQMLINMERLAALSPDTAVYAGHEFTLNNLAFALAVEPYNTAIYAAKARASAVRARDQATLPSTIGQERKINPFMRTHEPSVIHAIRQRTNQPMLEDPVAIFTALRHWKDTF